MQNKRDGESGQSLVELVLVLPFLLLVLFGIFDFGRILMIHQTVSEAARDATRYASIGDTDSQIGQTVQDDTTVLGNQVGWSVTPTGSRDSGTVVTVTVTDTVVIFDPIMMAFLGPTYTVVSSFSMRVE